MYGRQVAGGLIVVVGILVGLVPHAADAASTTVVISQVYGGGGDTGAAYAADYVELHNLTSSAVTLSGWALQYSFDTSTSPMLYQLSPFLIGTSIPAHGYFLVREHFGPNGSALPTPDDYGFLDLSPTAGKVALTNTNTPCPVPCSTDPHTVDFVGYGTTANEYEGTAAAPAPSTTLAVLRKEAGQTDTDQNSVDLKKDQPQPRNSASPPATGIGPVTSTTALALFQKSSSFTVKWSATDDSGVAAYESRARHATPSANFTSNSAWYDGTTTSSTYNGAAGQTVCISTMAQDTVGNGGAFSSEKCTAIPIDDMSLIATRFTRKTRAGYFNGTYSLSVSAGAKLTSKTITAKRLTIVATTCPSCGTVQVRWKGLSLGTFSLFSGTTKHGVLIPLTVFSTPQTGIAQILTLSAARVEIDGLGASRK